MKLQIVNLIKQNSSVINTPFFDAAIGKIAIASIMGSHKHISPHKRFSCAHRLLYCGESCSQYIKQSIDRDGFLATLKASRERFAARREANQILRARATLSPLEAQNEEERSRRNPSGGGRISECINTCADPLPQLGCELGCEAIDCATPICGGCSTPECDLPDCGDCGVGINFLIQNPKRD